MAIDETTGLPPDLNVTEDMMACPMPRVPLIDPENIPDDLRGELGPAYQWATRMWGTVPRYLRMLGHAPGAVEAWQLLDQKLRIRYLREDPDYVKIEELIIVKTALITKCNN